MSERTGSMAYCNAFGWKDGFSVTNSRLSEELCISRQELDRVRNILCQKELITYKNGMGNKCGIYHINWCCHESSPGRRRCRLGKKTAAFYERIR